MKELKDYTIGEVMLICESADNMCWIHKKNADYPNADCMERCLFYDASNEENTPCKIGCYEIPAYWDILNKSLGEYTANELMKRCHNRDKQCKGCFLKPLCDAAKEGKPGNWNI